MRGKVINSYIIANDLQSLIYIMNDSGFCSSSIIALLEICIYTYIYNNVIKLYIMFCNRNAIEIFCSLPKIIF